MLAMPASPLTQADKAIALLKEQGMARLSELIAAGATAATVARMQRKGQILQLSRGLYQAADRRVETHHALAEASKIVPKGIICLVTALAFHEMTDVMPSRVWMAINSRARKPSITYPPMEFVRFKEQALHTGVERHVIEGVSVNITNPARTIVDLFRYRRSEGRRFSKSTGITVALEGMSAALRQRNAMPADISKYAIEAGNWKVIEPYLEAMIANA